jgi:hypothetical protein
LPDLHYIKLNILISKFLALPACLQDKKNLSRYFEVKDRKVAEYDDALHNTKV